MITIVTTTAITITNSEKTGVFTRKCTRHYYLFVSGTETTQEQHSV